MQNPENFEHVSWSPSAAQVFDKCPRQFYYRHQQSERYTGGEKYVPSVSSYFGTVIHDCLANQVQRWARGESVHFQTATDQATDAIKEYVEANAETIAARVIDSGNDSFERDTLVQSLTRAAKKHIKQFFRVLWPQFDNHRYITHETRHSFEVCEEPVTVQPDLCTRSADGEFIVTDWKTSSHDRFGDPTIQMQAYALYAHEAYEPELALIRVQLAHTGTGEIDRMIPTPGDIERVQKRIKDDRRVWTNEGSIEAYEAEPEVGKCSRCSYLNKCVSGKKLLKESQIRPNHRGGSR